MNLLLTSAASSILEQMELCSASVQRIARYLHYQLKINASVQ